MKTDIQEKNFNMNNTKKKGKKSWEKSVQLENGTTKRVRVEEILNGYLITIEVYNFNEVPSINKTEKVFSKKNPLEDLDYTIVEDEGDVHGIIASFFNDKKQIL